jgi:hypothetical protein
MRKILWFACLAAGVAACADTGAWQKPSATPEQARADERECRAQAQYESRRDLRWREDVFEQSKDLGPDDRFSPTLRRGQFDAEYINRERRLTAECMSARGYTRGGW